MKNYIKSITFGEAVAIFSSGAMENVSIIDGGQIFQLIDQKNGVWCFSNPRKGSVEFREVEVQLKYEAGKMPLYSTNINPIMQNHWLAYHGDFVGMRMALGDLIGTHHSWKYHQNIPGVWLELTFFDALVGRTSAWMFEIFRSGDDIPVSSFESLRDIICSAELGVNGLPDAEAVSALISTMKDEAPSQFKTKPWDFRLIKTIPQLLPSNTSETYSVS